MQQIQLNIIHNRTVVRIISREEYEKGVCQCRSCNRMFHQSEIVRIQTEHSGLKEVIDNVCPYCGGKFGLVDYPVDEEINTYKSKSFYKKDKRYKYNIKHYNVNDFLFNDDEE